MNFYYMILYLEVKKTTISCDPVTTTQLLARVSTGVLIHTSIYAYYECTNNSGLGLVVKGEGGDNVEERCNPPGSEQRVVY